MKNLKKVLALVLVVATLMGLATVASAKTLYDYEDAASIKAEREEAVNVMSNLGVFQGTSNNFNPEGILTREEAAKIICYMVLTKEEADKLVANVAPYNDVSRDRWSAGPIGYCKSQGIIAGVGNGNYNPTGQLTGLQFAKMLLTALGYDASVEGLTGSQWGINTSKLAIAEAKIADGVTSAELEAPLSRQDACQLAFNTLTANMQEYLFKHSDYTTPHQNCLNNGGDYRNVNGDNVLQFCEKYFPKLTQRDTTDVFKRPSHEWRLDAQKIGEYVEWDKMLQEWTVKVTGKMVYDVVGSTTINDYTKIFAVDGETTEEVLGNAFFDKDDLTSSNKDAIGDTGKGVLTQVFQDNDTKELYVTVINTYLVKATEDYDTKNEDVNVNIYNVDNKDSSASPVFVKTDKEKESFAIKNEDIFVEEVKKDDIYICNLADGKIQYMWEPEILSEKVIVNFKQGSYVTSDGTQYDYADTVMYDEEVLDEYDDANMKDLTYDIILDDYGYLIGIERNEDPDQYLFLTGIDGSNSNIYAKSADANVVFMDGTMKTVKVNLDKSKFDSETRTDAGYKKNLSQLNTWCKYSVSSSDVYTLTEVKVAGQGNGDTNPTDGKKVKVAQFWQNVADFPNNPTTDPNKKSIDTKHVSLTAAGDRSLVYGNDATVYLNVSLKDINVADDAQGGRKRWIVDGVDTITTGIKDAKIAVEELSVAKDYLNSAYVVPQYEIYTLYDDKGYVKAAITIGEDEGVSSNYVFVTSSDTKLEAYATDTDWTWSREVITKTGKTDITENGESRKYLDPVTMERGNWYEVKYGANGHVRKVEPVEGKIDDTAKDDGFIFDVADLEEAVNSDKSTVILAHRGTNSHGRGSAQSPDALKYKNGTLYLTKSANKGIYVNPDVKTVLITADKTGKKYYDSIEDSYEGRDGLEKALKDMNANSDGPFNNLVDVHAIVEGSNGAVLIVIHDMNPKTSGGSSAATSNSKGPGYDEPGYAVNVATRDIYSALTSEQLDDRGDAGRRENIVAALASKGITCLKVNLDDSQAMDSQGRYWYINETEVRPIKVNGKIASYATRAFANGRRGSGTFTIVDTVKIDTTDGKHFKSNTYDGEGWLTSGYSPYTKLTKGVIYNADTSYTLYDDVEITTGYVSLTNSAAGVTVEQEKDPGYVKANTRLDVTYEITADTALAGKPGIATLTVDGKPYEASAKVDANGDLEVTFTVPGSNDNITINSCTFAPAHTISVKNNVSGKALKSATLSKNTISNSTGKVQLTLSIVGDSGSGETYTVNGGGANISLDSSLTSQKLLGAYASDTGKITIPAGASWNDSIVLTVTGVTADTEIEVS